MPRQLDPQHDPAQMRCSMATELAADNIRANSILAGFTASKSVLNHPAMMEKIRPHTINARMIKRDMTPDEWYRSLSRLRRRRIHYRSGDQCRWRCDQLPALARQDHAS
jgi:NAD(P)-dependent dehydrogenase (short-subunit alcohol dehydrogenase family)